MEEDLDDLLNIVTGDINLNVSYPHLIFKREDLINAMSLCNKLIQQKSDYTIYKSISFIPVKEYRALHLYSTNELYHFRYTAELINADNILIDNIFIPLVILQKLVKLMGNKVLLYKKEDNYYIRLLDGDLLLDCRPANMDILQFPGTPTDKVADLPIDSLGSVINSILPILNSDLKGENRRLSFTGEKAYFNSTLQYIESEISTPKLSLTIRDSEFINKLSSIYKGKMLKVYNCSLPNRIFVMVGSVRYQFYNSIGSVSDIFTNQMNRVISLTEMTVDYDKLFRVVNLATTLPGSSGNIKLWYESDTLKLSIISTKGESNFSIPSNKVFRELYNDIVILKAENLKKLLTSFNTCDIIGLALSDYGINLEYKGIRAILMRVTD